MKRWKKDVTFAKSMVGVAKDSVMYYAEHLADEAGLTGEERWLFLERVRQADGVRNVLAIIGLTTIVVTPYILIKAITR